MEGGGHISRRRLEFGSESHRKKGRLNRTLDNQVEEESMKVVLSREAVHY